MIQRSDGQVPIGQLPFVDHCIVYSWIGPCPHKCGTKHESFGPCIEADSESRTLDRSDADIDADGDEDKDEDEDEDVPFVQGEQ